MGLCSSHHAGACTVDDNQIESISDAILSCTHLRLLMSLCPPASSTFLLLFCALTVCSFFFTPTTVSHNTVSRIPKRIRRLRLLEELCCEHHHPRCSVACVLTCSCVCASDSGPQRNRVRSLDHPPPDTSESAQLFAGHAPTNRLPSSRVCVCVDSARKPLEDHSTGSVPAPAADSPAVFAKPFP